MAERSEDMSGARAPASRPTMGSGGAAPGDGAAETCDSCGATSDDLVAVHRLYVTPESWDTEGKVEKVEDVERWCFPCRTHYPHEVA